MVTGSVFGILYEEEVLNLYVPTLRHTSTGKTVFVPNSRQCSESLWPIGGIWVGPREIQWILSKICVMWQIVYAPVLSLYPYTGTTSAAPWMLMSQSMYSTWQHQLETDVVK